MADIPHTVSTLVVRGLRKKANFYSIEGGGSPGGGGDTTEWPQIDMVPSAFQDGGGTTNLPCYKAIPENDQELSDTLAGKVGEVASAIMFRTYQGTNGFGDMTACREYGALIYMSQDGKLGFTSLQEPSDDRTSIAFQEIADNYGRVIAMVHSHPPCHFNAGYPERLSFPSETRFRNDRLIGDWISYDQVKQNVTNAGGTHAAFRQYILGWVKTPTFEGWRLNMYNDANRYDSSDALNPNVSPGPEIEMNVLECM
jgi:hypothetical protein